MKKCRNCGFNNMEGRELCFKCGGALEHRVDLEPGKRLERLPRFDLEGGLLRRFSRVGRGVARALEVDLPTDVSHRFPYVAGALGLVPGLGQVYNRQPKKLLYFVPAFAACLAPAACFIATPYWGNTFVALAIAVSLFSFSDAMATAGRINGQQFTLRGRLALMTYPVFLLGAIGFLMGVLAWMNWPIFTLYYIGAEYMEPAIAKGDRICGEAVSLWFRGPRPGDVVRYDPPRFRLSTGSGDYSVNPQNGWERVMAVGGETLESVDGVLYVNGRELSREYYPLLPGNLPLRFRIECPEGKYLIVISALAEDEGIINMLRRVVHGGGAARVPFLVGASWEKACIVERKEIWDRSRFIYAPTTRRRVLDPKGPRFADESSL
ncbi:hypothetical protein JW916_11390 [Candidatus Sumerlaeota bacterium]|nr:hypothetical protein [Candidatus Sumerlaeota bacterium]